MQSAGYPSSGPGPVPLVQEEQGRLHRLDDPMRLPESSQMTVTSVLVPGGRLIARHRRFTLNVIVLYCKCKWCIFNEFEYVTFVNFYAWYFQKKKLK